MWNCSAHLKRLAERIRLAFAKQMERRTLKALQMRWAEVKHLATLSMLDPPKTTVLLKHSELMNCWDV